MEERDRTGFFVLNQRGNGSGATGYLVLNQRGNRSGATGYLVLNQRGNGSGAELDIFSLIKEAMGVGQSWISSPKSKRQWIDIRWRSGLVLNERGNGLT